MKLSSEKTPPPAPPPASPTRSASAIIAAPGDAFVTRRLDLPPGIGADEIAGFVSLQLEELAPFSGDQLFHGYLAAADKSAVFVYAAYRRRFPAEQTEAWPKAVFVLPDFAPALNLSFDSETVVLLRADNALTALLFEGGKPLPVRSASRPLAAGSGSDAEERVRRTVISLVGGAPHAREVALHVARPPQQRALGLVTTLEPDGSGTARTVQIPTDDCWTMDVRDPEFVAQQRRRAGVDLVIWRVVQGAAAAVALLVIGELLLLAGQGYKSWLSHRVASRTAAVAAIQEKESVANALEDFSRSGLQPFDMFNAVGPVRPGSVQFTAATADGRNTLSIDGTAANIAEYNAYLEALRGVPQVQNVAQRKEPQSRDITTFWINVTFRPDAFPRTAPPAAVASSAPEKGTQ